MKILNFKKRLKHFKKGYFKNFENALERLQTLWNAK
jgi:hypothetical protein